jgi:hypothetical protein
LKSENSFKLRQHLTVFHLSDHSFEIESDRYRYIPREQREYTACKYIDDEQHFFIDCNKSFQIKITDV